ncbi:MAG: 6,7-dimethyl-8-ribityllumazine synthase [Actinomycetota bacterium]
MTEFRGERAAEGRRFAVVASRFNESITAKLLAGALDCFASAGVEADGVDVAWVPGAFELPIAARRLAESGRYAGIVCVGAVIRGETQHHEIVGMQSAAGIRAVTEVTGVPVLLGVVTTEDLAQARERAGGAHGNRGWDAAAAALEVASLLDRLPRRP